MRIVIEPSHHKGVVYLVNVMGIGAGSGTGGQLESVCTRSVG